MAKQYLSRRVKVAPWGTAEVMEFNSLGHFVQVCRDTLKETWTNHNSFKAGECPALDTAEAIETATVGLDSLVPASDAMLDKLEALLPDMELKSWEIARSVVGCLPHVPAYLTGEPNNMLTRRRVLKQETPLTVYLDLISTCDVSQEEHLVKGAAILALVRILSARRPVTLYAGMQCDAHGKSNYAGMLYFPVDTAPLDLARAAYIMSHQSFTRGLQYCLARQEIDYRGRWAWNNSDLHRDRGQAVVKAVLNTEDVLYIPPLQSQDPDYRKLVDHPAEWLTERVQKYGHVMQE